MTLDSTVYSFEELCVCGRMGMDRYSEYGRVSEYRFAHSLNLNSITTGYGATRSHW